MVLVLGPLKSSDTVINTVTNHRLWWLRVERHGSVNSQFYATERPMWNVVELYEMSVGTGLFLTKFVTIEFW
jgi:hypothetical protein